MWVFSSIKIWIPLAFLLLINIVYKKTWKQYLPVLTALILLFVICDQLSSHLIKPLIARPRPTHYPGIMEHVRTLFDYTGGKYGFISGHATNSFGFAMFSSLLFRNKLYTAIVFLWAAVVAYSRIFIGVHFVSDILGGIIAGVSTGYLLYNVYSYTIKKTGRNGSFTLASFPGDQMKLLSVIILVYLIFISLFSTYIVAYQKSVL
ncbi:MAG: phosphatase PAP2 family protein [Mediterranea sp.]|nr:phosphatase PAP2 family protein [Mediterranea sp.]